MLIEIHFLYNVDELKCAEVFSFEYVFCTSNVLLKHYFILETQKCYCYLVYVIGRTPMFNWDVFTGSVQHSQRLITSVDNPRISQRLSVHRTRNLYLRTSIITFSVTIAIQTNRHGMFLIYGAEKKSWGDESPLGKHKTQSISHMKVSINSFSNR